MTCVPRAERRRKQSVIAGGVLLCAALVAGCRHTDTALEKVGVQKVEASCLDPRQEPIPDDAVGGVKHTTLRVDYPDSPPTAGRHDPSPLPVGAKKFYSRDEQPAPERAVHNLEHAYVVVWYDTTVTDAQVELLRDAADAASGKFLVVPWDRGVFPDDKHIVLTAWGQRQQCAGVSGAVMQEFMDDFGGANGTAPEKGAL